MAKHVASALAMARRITAMLAVLVSLYLPAAPVLQAALAASPSCTCCDRAGAKCCRLHHASSSGPAVREGSSCCGTCLQAPGIVPPDVHLIPVKIPDFTISLGATQSIADRDGFSPVRRSSFWLFQRPPPRG